MSWLSKWTWGMCLSVLAGWGPPRGASGEPGFDPGPWTAPARPALVSRKHSLVEPPVTQHLGLFRPGTGLHGLWVGVDGEELAAVDAEWATYGMRVEDLGVRTDPYGGVAFSGAWLPGSGAHTLRTGLSWDALVSEWRSLATQGLRLVDLEVYAEHGIRQYAGVWREGTDGYALYSGVTWEQLTAQRQRLASQGLRLVDVETFVQDGQRVYAGVWRAGQDGEELWAGGDQAALEEQISHFAASGLRLVDVQTYWEDDGWKFLGLFRPGQDAPRLVTGQDWDTFTNTWETLTDQGLRLTTLQTHSAPAWESTFHWAVGNDAMGYAYAIVENGRITRSGGVGHARAPDEQTEPGVAMTARSRVHLASVSKPITATALMQLVEREGLSLDAPFYPHVSSRWPVAAPGVEQITLRQLLTHRSGLAQWGYCGDDFEDSMRQLLAAPMEHPPGWQSYSNGNFCLLRAVIEAVSGTEYETYVKTNVFAPLGITAMSCTPDATGGTLYYASGARSPGHFWAEDYRSQCGAYGWYGSATDLATFLIGLRQHTVLSPAATATLFDDGLGWWPAGSPGGTAFFHDGAWITADGRGCNTGILRLPNGVDAVLLSNTHGVDIIGTLLGAYSVSPYAL